MGGSRVLHNDVMVLGYLTDDLTLAVGRRPRDVVQRPFARV